MEWRARINLNAISGLIGAAAILITAASGYAGTGLEDASAEIWIDGPDAVQPGNDRGDPDVAVDETGRRIQVWRASPGVEANDIYLRRFDAAGNPLEDPRIVNTTTANGQNSPAVAVAADGSFLVTFESSEFDSTAGFVYRYVRSQAYDANGDTVGTEQLLSSISGLDNVSLDSDVAALRSADGSAGGYVAVWFSRQSTGTDSNRTIQGCLLSASGVPGAQFQVNSDDAPQQRRPSVTELNDGGFLATWTVENNQIVGRRFNAAGGPIGNDFVISTSFVAGKLDNDAAVGWNGQVLVAWADQEDSGDNGREIYARLYDQDLNPLGPDFRVNTVIESDQLDPRVVDLGPRGFLVVWESIVSSGDDADRSIESRIVVGPNQFGGPQTQVNVWTENSQSAPGAHGWYGRAAINWRTLSLGVPPIPPSNTDDHIVGRDIEHCLFCDDFEWFSPASSGNLWRWSNSQGVVGRPDSSGED